MWELESYMWHGVTGCSAARLGAWGLGLGAWGLVGAGVFGLLGYTLRLHDPQVTIHHLVMHKIVRHRCRCCSCFRPLYRASASIVPPAALPLRVLDPHLMPWVLLLSRMWHRSRMLPMATAHQVLWRAMGPWLAGLKGRGLQVPGALPMGTKEMQVWGRHSLQMWPARQRRWMLVLKLVLPMPRTPDGSTRALCLLCGMQGKACAVRSLDGGRRRECG